MSSRTATDALMGTVVTITAQQDTSDRVGALADHQQAQQEVEAAYDPELEAWLGVVLAALLASGPFLLLVTVAGFTTAAVFAVDPAIVVASRIGLAVARAEAGDADVDDDAMRPFERTQRALLTRSLVDEAEDVVRMVVDEFGRDLDDDEVKAALRAGFDPQSAYWRAHVQRVSRTLVTAAISEGVLRGAEARRAATGERLGLEWMALDDGRTRRTHDDADGQVVQLGQRFRVGTALLSYPGDPLGPANEVVNCRCRPRVVRL